METLSKLHPLVVHFPVALFSVYVLFEVINLFLQDEKFHKWINLVLLIGVLGGIAAVLTGNQAAASLQQNYQNIASEIIESVEEHESYATITLWFFAVLLAARFYLTTKKKFNKLLKVTFVILALIGMFLIYETGEHGGELVYGLGIGTELFH